MNHLLILKASRHDSKVKNSLLNSAFIEKYGRYIINRLRPNRVINSPGTLPKRDTMLRTSNIFPQSILGSYHWKNPQELPSG